MNLLWMLHLMPWASFLTFLTLGQKNCKCKNANLFLGFRTQHWQQRGNMKDLTGIWNAASVWYDMCLNEIHQKRQWDKFVLQLERQHHKTCVLNNSRRKSMTEAEVEKERCRVSGFIRKEIIEVHPKIPPEIHRVKKDLRAHLHLKQKP